MLISLFEFIALFRKRIPVMIFWASRSLRTCFSIQMHGVSGRYKFSFSPYFVSVVEQFADRIIIVLKGS